MSGATGFLALRTGAFPAVDPDLEVSLGVLPMQLLKRSCKAPVFPGS
jgi:hypothetical protein